MSVEPKMRPGTITAEEYGRQNATSTRGMGQAPSSSSPTSSPYPFVEHAQEIATQLEHLADAPNEIHRLLLEAEASLALVNTYLRCRARMARREVLSGEEATAMQCLAIGTPISTEDARALQRVVIQHGFRVGGPLRAEDAVAIRRVLSDHGYQVGASIQPGAQLAIQSILAGRGYVSTCKRRRPRRRTLLQTLIGARK